MFVLVMGYFNVKVKVRLDPEEKGIGAYAQEKNEGENLLLNYLKKTTFLL